MGRIAPPGMPKTSVTPNASRVVTMACAPVITRRVSSVIISLPVGLRFRFKGHESFGESWGVMHEKIPFTGAVAAQTQVFANA